MTEHSFRNTLWRDHLLTFHWTRIREKQTQKLLKSLTALEGISFDYEITTYVRPNVHVNGNIIDNLWLYDYVYVYFNMYWLSH